MVLALWLSYHRHMFSYRHAFHAGNHADVLKHITLIATLRHLMQKDAGILFVDTHAGAGLYRLDGDYASKSGEASEGFLKLHTARGQSPAIDDYLDLIASFNQGQSKKVYPGSPFIIQHLMRHASRDRLKLFEMHPTDIKSLSQNIAQLEAGRSVSVAEQDGFESLKSLLPPPPSGSGSRRACVLIDPSYEIKTDYFRVTDTIADALKRFPTGTYLVWYPIVGRAEAHDLPRRLKGLCNPLGKSWLHATLAIGREYNSDDQGLSASGMFVINPPYTLRPLMEQALPILETQLGRGLGQSWLVETGGH
jgi:23S rRNA (adenine2030-N6)-methyltransferase